MKYSVLDIILYKKEYDYSKIEENRSIHSKRDFYFGKRYMIYYTKTNDKFCGKERYIHERRAE